MKLAENLKNLRLQKKMTQKQLAEVLGITPEAITMWETGKRIPVLEMLIKIANYFDVSLDDLIGRDN